jgi:hypothetical protein
MWGYYDDSITAQLNPCGSGLFGLDLAPIMKLCGFGATLRLDPMILALGVIMASREAAV